MKTLSILNELSKIGFTMGLFTARNNHFSYSSKLPDKSIFVNIMICCHKNVPMYMLTLQIEDKNVINELELNEDQLNDMLLYVNNNIERYINDRTKICKDKKDIKRGDNIPNDSNSE